MDERRELHGGNLSWERLPGGDPHGAMRKLLGNSRILVRSTCINERKIYENDIFIYNLTKLSIDCLSLYPISELQKQAVRNFRLSPQDIAFQTEIE